MKPLFQFALILLFTTLFSCGNNHEEQKNDSSADSTTVETAHESVDTLQESIADTSAAEEDTVGTEGIAVEEEEITEEKVVEETGMSFCDCVKTQKEIQKKIDESEDDEELMQLMQEMNNLRNGDCKVLFIQDQTSVDQVEERKRRIAACQ